MNNDYSGFLDNSKIYFIEAIIIMIMEAVVHLIINQKFILMDFNVLNKTF